MEQNNISKTKKTMKKYSREIIVGTIVSIITAWVCRGYDLFILLISQAGETFHIKCTNIIISRAAAISQFSVFKVFLDFITTTSSIVLFIAVILVFSTVWIKPKYAEADVERFGKLVDYLEKEISKNSSKTESSKDDEAELKRLELQIKRLKRMAIILSVLSIILVILFSLYSFVFIISPLSLWNDFETAVTAIAPYITEGEEENLRADWIFMKSESDFQDVYKKIEEVAKEHGIVNFEWSVFGVLISDSTEVAP